MTEINNSSRYVTLDDIIKLYMVQIDAPNNSKYLKYMTLAQLAYQELEMDVLKKFTYRYLPVDATTKTVAIPDDMQNYTRIGFVNQVGEIIDLGYDPNLAFPTEILSPVCEDACDECGCLDEICDAVSNVTAEETSVTLATPVRKCNYSVTLLFSQFQGICAPHVPPYTIASISYGSGKGLTTTFSPAYPINNAGDLTAFTNAYIITGLGYTLTYGDASICTKAVSTYSDYPMTLTSYKKNGVTVLDGTVCANLAQLVLAMAALGWNNVTTDGCNDATVSVSLPLQKCTYSTGGFPFIFNNFSITLGGAFQFITGAYTTVDQIVNVLNALVTGAGYFYKISNSTFGAIINSATANYFGNFRTTPPTGYTTNTNTNRWDISAFTFPLVSASVVIDGVTYTNNSAIANGTALVAWLNTLTTTAQGIFSLATATTITITHYEQAKDAIVTYPTTSVSVTINGIVYTNNTPMANVSAIVTWLNTLGVGAFGIYINGGEPITIYYLGLQNWTSMAATWGGGSSSGSTSTIGGNCAFNLVTTLNGCYSIPTTNFTISNSADTWEDFIITGHSTSAQTVVVDVSSCAIVTTDVAYTNICRTCTDADGNVTKECCIYGNDYSTPNCNYTIDLINGDGESFSFPLTDGVLIKNGANVTVPTIDDFPELIDFMEANGFVLTDITNMTFVGYGLTDSFTSISSVLQVLSFDFDSSTCLDFEIEQNCTTTEICKVALKACGCPELNDEVINTLYNCNLINNNMFQRWFNGGDISTTYLQPFNSYGFYNVDMHRGIIQLDPFFQYDTIYLEYYGTEAVKSKDFAVPLLVRDFILAYIHKMTNIRKDNMGRMEKEAIKKECRAAKHNLKLRWQPPRENQIVQILRTPPSKA